MSKRKYIKKCIADEKTAEEFFAVIRPLLRIAEVQSMKRYAQHGKTDCFSHCLFVAYAAYCKCLKKGLNACAAARAGMLHDMFLYDWHGKEGKPFKRLHGYRHPAVALSNAEKIAELTPMEQDMIGKHMWPLTVSPPKYRESFVLSCADKRCTMAETFRTKKSARIIAFLSERAEKEMAEGEADLKERHTHE